MRNASVCTDLAQTCIAPCNRLEWCLEVEINSVLTSRKKEFNFAESLLPITMILDLPFGARDLSYSQMMSISLQLTSSTTGHVSSIQSVMRDAFGNVSSPAIDSSGCLVNGTRDCFSACNDSEMAPNMVWRDSAAMHTFANCAIYPIIVSLMQLDLLDTGSVELAAEYGFVNDTRLAVPGEAAWQVINNCTSAYCDSVSKPGTDCTVQQPTYTPVLYTDPRSSGQDDITFLIVSVYSYASQRGLRHSI
jgi:hypothetical protein